MGKFLKALVGAGVVLFIGLSIQHFMDSDDGAPQTTAAPITSAADGSEYTDAEFVTCITNKARTGKYSSSNKYGPLNMMISCPQSDAWIAHCKSRTRTGDQCATDEWYLASEAIREAGY